MHSIWICKYRTYSVKKLLEMFYGIKKCHAISPRLLTKKLVQHGRTKGKNYCTSKTSKLPLITSLSTTRLHLSDLFLMMEYT